MKTDKWYLEYEQWEPDQYKYVTWREPLKAKSYEDAMVEAKALFEELKEQHKGFALARSGELKSPRIAKDLE